MFSKDKKCEIAWDIAAILKDIENIHPIMEYRNVLYLSEQDGGICTDPDYAMKTDIEKPCIIVKLNENTEIFIDGNHRLYKARMLNIENILCYILPIEYHKKFILDFNTAIYEKISDEYRNKERKDI